MKQLRKPAGGIVLCLVLWMAGASLMLAQIKSGSIVGAVTDESGAFIPDATVSITNQDTKVVTSVRTDSAGQYAAPYLEAGQYTVHVEKKGFAAFEATGVSITGAQQARVDAQLHVGATAATVQVVGSLAKLQTETASFTSTVNARVIESVPEHQLQSVLLSNPATGSGGIQRDSRYLVGLLVRIRYAGPDQLCSLLRQWRPGPYQPPVC